MCIISFINKLLLRVNPELAHCIVMKGLKHNLIKNHLCDYSNYLKVSALGLNFNHPIGLAAGFDKNAECVQQLLNVGFSFVEAGTVTMEPQSGNLKPRLFRLREDQAIINRLGFNNSGIKCFERNLERRSNRQVGGVVGINIGKNKDVNDPISDYVKLIKHTYLLADYITINISSPNTPHLRELQKKEILERLLIAINSEISTIDKSIPTPILLKVAPDINDQQKESIVSLALKYKVDGIILTNTTIGLREGLHSSNKIEYGGLSGKPLFDLSTQVLGEMYKFTNDKITLIGCGGIFSGEDAYKKIKAGASLLQIYTAVIYNGFGVIDKINLELIELLKRDGFSTIKEAIGIDAK